MVKQQTVAKDYISDNSEVGPRSQKNLSAGRQKLGTIRLSVKNTPQIPFQKTCAV